VRGALIRDDWGAEAPLSQVHHPPILSTGRWEPRIRASLEDMIASYGLGSEGYDRQRPPVATFDWDHTSIQGDIQEAVLHWLDARDGGRRSQVYEHMAAEVGKPTAYQWAAEIVAGLYELEVRELTLQVVESYLSKGGLRFRPEMRDLMFALQLWGWQVWVVSASAEVVVQTIAQFYGVPADRVIGVKLAISADGLLLPFARGPLTYRMGKVEAIDTFIGRRPTFAAGDTDTDIEMLQASRHVLLMDRGNDEALAAARSGGWWVQPPGW
jgi:HAD superfamily phosphoserine phosphatase-like hydrolase